MAGEPNRLGGTPPDASGAGAGGATLPANPFAPDIPPSKPLQWFLLAALVITGVAYVVDQWTERTTSETKVRTGTRLHRMVQSQIDYLAHSKAGDEALANQHYDKAVSEYRLALQSEDTGSGHEHFGQALLKAGDPNAAFAQFREALRLDPGLVNVASAWGLALVAEGKPEDASGVFREALQRNPDSGLLHYNLATALLQLRINAQGRRRMAAAAGQAQEAQAAEAQAKDFADGAFNHFSHASRNGVNSPAFWSSYGQLLNELGRYAQAEPCLLRAASKDTNIPSTHFQLALTEEHLGKYAQAIEHYEKVLTLLPDDAPTLNSLALLYATATNAEVRSPKMAVQLATRACDATTDQNARYMDTLARSYAASSDFFQAITWEDKAIHRATQLNDEDLKRELQARYALFLEHKRE